MGDQPRVRRNVYSLDPKGAELTSYAQGITAMQARPANDPTSWTFWAAMHGSRKRPSTPLETQLWNGCQHGCWFFLSWHRMYIYFFENMIQAASGDPSFGLPYWNYSDQYPQWAALPPPFQAPPTGAAPLYVPNRDAGINSGSSVLPQGDVDYANAYAVSEFYRSIDNGFGGGPPAGDSHFDTEYGQLEMTPHNAVHNDVGGWMTDPDTAAQDPIFWCHHSNIDRLWEGWLKANADPTDAGWLDRQYPFVDTSGKTFTITFRQFAQTYGGNVSYNDPPAGPPGTADPPAGGSSPMSPVNGPAPSRRTLAVAPEGSYELTGRRSVVSVPLQAEARSYMAEAADPAAGKRVGLRIDDIQFDEPPKGPYQVFLNLPEGTTPDYRSPYYVGNVTFFGHAHEPGARRRVGSHRFDVTRQVSELKAKGEWDDGQVKVTFVPSGPVPAPGAETPGEPAEEELSKPKAWVGHVSLFNG
ncbi:MAG TPA: tyrosinase family protein [Actinomycetota bacterium]|nr:tyrosinase family protein [Actinomycetota bacterium]